MSINEQSKAFLGGIGMRDETPKLIGLPGENQQYVCGGSAMKAEYPTPEELRVQDLPLTDIARKRMEECEHEWEEDTCKRCAATREPPYIPYPH